ncbi:MAG TPA: potassium channel family protein, partial [Desulfurivibrionaceae bacterium]|nr:potassium channel family protein [Desulfurivibrionaceae bacterium]
MNSLTARLRFFLITLFVVMGLGTWGFTVLEHLAPADAFYFNIVTMATVGYGDIHPTTPAGKLLAILIIVLGTGTFLGVIATATDIMLSRRDKQSRLRKHHILIGVYFSELGNRLLAAFSAADPQLAEIQDQLVVSPSWQEAYFTRAAAALTNHPHTVETRRVDLPALNALLNDRRAFLVGLLEHPTLLEHDIFTEHLQAVFHLAEELTYRDNLVTLPDSDRQHL